MILRVVKNIESKAQEQRNTVHLEKNSSKLGNKAKNKQDVLSMSDWSIV